MRGGVNADGRHIDWELFYLHDHQASKCEFKRDHLRNCRQCREEFNRYFPLELWSRGGLALERVPTDFTARVMRELCLEAPACAGDLKPARSLPRRQILWNYLATAAVTLALVYGGFFSSLLHLNESSGRLNSGVHTLYNQTQRLVEARPNLAGVWQKLTEGLAKTFKGGNHDEKK